MKFVTIGGGSIFKGETLPIDKEIIKLTGKKKPKALFIPTASGDPEDYCKAFKKVYGRKCKVDNLLLIKEKYTKKEISKKILWADLIYVGGGNTLRMMKLWRELGVDKLLKKAGKKGTVLSGLSAGCICWYNYGHSDSRRYSGNKNWKSIRVKGLGFLDFFACPHYHKEKRERSFRKMMKKYNGIGMAIDNNSAVCFVNDKFKIIKSKRTGKVYRIYKKGKRVIEEELKNTEFKSIKELK